ncbi:YcxB family protein [Longispora sp. K20-0274]|uniref:YcxB family protein n=1 Tax=Longispora sp. K20-0274 TaxID=3088255 RepID=UPI003999E69B
MNIHLTVPISFRYMARVIRATFGWKFWLLRALGGFLLALQLLSLLIGDGVDPATVGVGLAAMLLPTLIAWLSYRQAAGVPEAVFTLTDEGLHARTPTATAQFRWEGFTKSRETKHFFLLRGQSRATIPLPKERFGPGEADQFRAKLRDAVPTS